MRVMCIDDTQTLTPNILVYGAIYNVYKKDSIQGIVVYYTVEVDAILKEPTPLLPKRFIPLSDIDETELINQKIEHESRINH